MAADKTLTIAERELNGDGRTIELAGELDMSTAPQLVSAAAAGKPLVIDLSQLTFMDSTGLSALIAISGECETLRLVPGPETVQRVFEITNTEDRFEWIESPRA